jgi:hypothetical protein
VGNNVRHPVKPDSQEERAVAERAVNKQAKELGLPLPYPNIWDLLDPTKVDQDATPEEIHKSYQEFRKLCPPRPRKRHVI